MFEIVVKTSKPRSWLRDIKKKIRNRTIRTWTCDEEGDFTHVSRQWNKKAWLWPRIKPGKSLRFKLIGQDGVPMDKTVAGIFVGRFSGMLCTHLGTSVTINPWNPTPRVGRRLAAAHADLHLRSALGLAQGF